jgi:long-subunit acyl-CoA synthetase (AMP-forming)
MRTGPRRRKIAAMHTETLIGPSAGEDTTAGMPTICAAFQATAARYPDRLALRLPGEGIEWTWDEYAARVRRAAHTLHALGVRRGDRVALLLRNRPEHLLADLAAVHLGATPFSIYATSAPPQVAYLVRDSGACVLITEAAFEATAAAVAPCCGGLEHVLRMTSGAPELESVESPAFEFEQSWRAVTPADPVCLIYTSRTTGPPMGAEITHQGVLANLRGTWRTLRVTEGLTAVSFLPLAHLVERLTSHYSAIALAGTVTCCPDAAALALALAETRRTAFAAPPRMWEQQRATREMLLDWHPLPQQTGPALDPYRRLHTGDLGRLGLLAGAVSTTNARLSRFEQIERHMILDADVANLPHQPGTREEQRSRQNSVSLRPTVERSHVRRS